MAHCSTRINLLSFCIMSCARKLFAGSAHFDINLSYSLIIGYESQMLTFLTTRIIVFVIRCYNFLECILLLTGNFTNQLEMWECKLIVIKYINFVYGFHQICKFCCSWQTGTGDLYFWCMTLINPTQTKFWIPRCNMLIFQSLDIINSDKLLVFVMSNLKFHLHFVAILCNEDSRIWRNSIKCQRISF